MSTTTTLERCEICGAEHPAESLTVFDGTCLCETCFEEETVCCADCGERFWRESNAGSDSHPLCQDCFDRHYTVCADCGTLLRFDDASYFDCSDLPYCAACFDRRYDLSCIHDYSYKPEPIFFGNGPRYFGVELEMDGAGEDQDNAREILQQANRDADYAYIKHDGSLNEGLELVTHPMSLTYHTSHFPWAAVLESAVQLGYRSHQAGTCGLHIHVSRDAFGATEEEADEAIARVLYFVEKHWNELLRFSRRTQRQLDHWAARYGYKDHPKELIKEVRKGCGNRYTCVNLTNASTIEFRIFRGTLKLNTLIATLQLVNKICDVAISFSDEQLKAMSWSEFVLGVHEPELIQYLKERRLYVSERVESEEDL